MAETATEIREEAVQIANTIRQQIGVWPLAEIGARDLIAYANLTLSTEDYPMPGLRFTAKPRHRLVTVDVLLDQGRDTYIVRVSDRTTGAVKYRLEDVYCDDLATIIRTLADHV